MRCSLPHVESSAEMDWAKHQEVDTLAGGHGITVHDRLEVAKPRHLIDDDKKIALKRFLCQRPRLGWRPTGEASP